VAMAGKRIASDPAVPIALRVGTPRSGVRH
jgi:hypothetical protein